MALQRHLWHTGWALVTLERSDYSVDPSEAMSWQKFLTCQIMPSQGNPMALQRHLWYTGLVLITPDRSGDLSNTIPLISHAYANVF